MFLPRGLALPGAAPGAYLIGVASYLAKLGLSAAFLAMVEVTVAKMRVFRVPDFLSAALMLALLATLLLFVSQGI